MKTENKQSSTDGKRNIATVSKVHDCKKYPHTPNFNVENGNCYEVQVVCKKNCLCKIYGTVLSVNIDIGGWGGGSTN